MLPKWELTYYRYWLPDLLKYPYIALRFLPQEAYEAAALLTVTPEPTSVVRIFMLWRGLKHCEVEEDLWSEAMDRASEMSVIKWRDVVGLDTKEANDHGLRVLEWGGMEVKN